MHFPDEPEVPAEQIASAEGPIRYEDVAQDGRILVGALPQFLGIALWRTMATNTEVARAAARAGIVPILTRLTIVGSNDGPISSRKPVAVTGRYQLAHTVNEAGAVNRLVMGMWVSAVAPRGRMHGGPVEGAGEPVAIGRVFGEHVFTRLFAPPAERKVLELPGGIVPDARYVWTGGDRLLEVPAGAVCLDDGLVADELTMVFGITHTDSNLHVNSLVYPRLFEEAALRRFAARGKSPAVLARVVEIAYRKPCFAGDRVKIELTAYVMPDGSLGAIGVFVPAEGEDRRASCWIRVAFSA